MSTITRTPRVLIRGSLLAIRAVGQNEDIDNEQYNDAFTLLNEMLASWSSEPWIFPVIVQESFSGSGASSYTIGSGATWDTDRPLDIMGGFIRHSSASDYPLRLMTREDYNDLVNKSTGQASRLYYYKAYPNGTVYFDGIVASGQTAYLDLQKPISSIATLDTTIVLPPEHAALIRYQLCLRLAPEYDKKVPDTVAFLARESMNNIINANAEQATMELDTALQPCGYTMRSING